MVTWNWYERLCSSYDTPSHKGLSFEMFQMHCLALEMDLDEQIKSIEEDPPKSACNFFYFFFFFQQPADSLLGSFFLCKTSFLRISVFG